MKLQIEEGIFLNSRTYEKSHRFRNKVNKLIKYWNGDNIGIPQPFRLISGNSKSKKEVLEFIDLSLKEVLCKLIFN